MSSVPTIAEMDQAQRRMSERVLFVLSHELMGWATAFFHWQTVAASDRDIDGNKIYHGWRCNACRARFIRMQGGTANENH